MSFQPDGRSALMRTVLLLAAILVPCSGLADRVQVPLSLDQRYIETLVREEAFKGAGDSVRINDDGSGCQFLELRDPKIRFESGQVIVRTRAAARAGRSLGGQCMLLLNWHGQLEFIQTPIVGEDRRSVLLRNSSWRALRPDGRTDNLSTTIARWLEQYLPLELRQTRVDLSEPMGQLEEFLALVTAPDASNPVAIPPVRLEVDRIAATSADVAVTIGFDIQPSPQPAQSSQPELRPDELALLEQKLDAVDAFVTYTISSMLQGAELADTGPLFDLLIEIRRDLIRILSTPQRSGEDPARALFVTAWNGLNPYLREIAEQQTDYLSAIRYLSFIGAGDALRALDAIGPAAGIEISSDGLRRLARILIPDDPADPLRTDNGVDEELRKSFGFGDPIPPPQIGNRTSWLEWFIPSAVAATLNPDTTERLNNWVPKPGDINSYLPMVRDVLQHVIVEQLRSKELNAAYHEVYRSLVYTAAWQESCWRQFVAKDQKRVPMQSGSGDIGMMQINPKVWRGFYDLQGLRWDIVYNARAGADILEHHIVNYAVRHREHETTGNLDSLARSTYAAYNGGPRQYNRYRRADASAQEKKIDALFYEKYRKVKTSGALAVAACY